MMTNDAFARAQLVAVSKSLIKMNQHPSGGYAACPLFSHYAYSWLRDGSFIAYSMDITGETDSADKFHRWVNGLLLRQRERVNKLLDKHERGEWIEQHEFLHTRYQLDGRDDADSAWGQFQLDGYGVWLWAVAEHCRTLRMTALPDLYRESVDLIVRYLCAFWQRPNFDCWEERGEQVHPSTLASIYGGLSSIQPLIADGRLGEICSAIREFILDYAVHPTGGHIVKSIRPTSNDERYEIAFDGVDGSLLWLCEPFNLLSADHPAMAATIARIQQDLKSSDGGLRRYLSDEYYGGGEWTLLAAWYGWTSLRTGAMDEARLALAWVMEQADSLGRLPEQVPHTQMDSQLYERWLQNWGPPATPLLWSHAMFLVLNSQLHG
ncbi:glycoside hydrolase family 15 protein [Paenibacillus xerothermodurans]|uniref:Glycoside hydrolase n=1 Tax=Paenibacillus xerothermodurans TaxID=1977292 RepID=A0A2W1P4N9_PAEXE|nr:glycoside hydrolase family 15 protein [Paenibacillus xerothermodurans]PZE22682.1 glycoside hydrolase [Paenibacillus xerothermodurans]